MAPRTRSAKRSTRQTVVVRGKNPVSGTSKRSTGRGLRKSSLNTSTKLCPLELKVKMVRVTIPEKKLKQTPLKQTKKYEVLKRKLCPKDLVIMLERHFPVQSSDEVLETPVLRHKRTTRSSQR